MQSQSLLLLLLRALLVVVVVLGGTGSDSANVLAVKVLRERAPELRG